MRKRWILFHVLIMLLLIAVPLQASSFPVEVITSEDGKEIRKVYKTDDPEQIPKEDFERGGMTYTLTDILHSEVPVTEYKEYEETAAEWSKTQDTASVLAVLPASKEAAVNGYAGTLTLDASSIQVEVSGYGSSSKTVTAARSYPNLAAADTQNLPKTITENGVVMNLADVQWNTDNTRNLNDYEISDRYTAYVTYTGAAKSSYVKGYNVTAKYTGTLQKTTTDSRYTAIFVGKKVRNWPVIIMTTLATILSLAAIGLTIWDRMQRYRKEQSLVSEKPQKEPSEKTRQKRNVEPEEKVLKKERGKAHEKKNTGPSIRADTDTKRHSSFFDGA